MCSLALPRQGEGKERKRCNPVSDQLLLAGLEETARRHRRGGQQVEDRAEADGDRELAPEAAQAGAAAGSDAEQPEGQEREQRADARADPIKGFLAQAAREIEDVAEGQGSD